MLYEALAGHFHVTWFGLSLSGTLPIAHHREQVLRTRAKVRAFESRERLTSGRVTLSL